MTMNADILSPSWLAQIRQAVSQLELALSDMQLSRLTRHLELIEKWNRVYNLTAICDIKAMIAHHLIDSARPKTRKS